MKKRTSQHFAERNMSREDWYRKAAESIAFDSNSEIIERNGTIYLKNAETEVLLYLIDQPKHKWYRTWLAIKS